MSTFDVAFERILRAEGPMSDRKNDHGGLTKFGISQRWNPKIDVANLTVADARAFYADKWTRWGLEQLPPRIALKIFDFAVNADMPDAARAAQRALCYLGAPVAVDGKLGPVTRAAIRAYRNPDALLAAICGFQHAHYADVVEKDPDQVAFAGGWAIRAAWRP